MARLSLTGSWSRVFNVTYGSLMCKLTLLTNVSMIDDESIIDVLIINSN